MASQFPDFSIPPEIRNLKDKIIPLAIGFAVIIISFSMWFTIDPEEVGVILRFGKYNRTVNSGLNFKLPFGIESLTKVPVERQLKQEFGFITEYNSKSNQEDVSLMLTGDLNLATVEWVIQYRISDPYKYLFKLRNPETTLKDLSEATMRQVVGDRTVNEVLTVGRQEVASKVEELLQKLCTDYESGIKIEQVVLQNVTPPDPVKPSFNGVNEAQQEKEKLINEALSGYNKIIPKAKGQALETIQKAEGYALDRVNTAKGNVAKFNALYGEYVKAPEITKKRIYLETMGNVIPKLGSKIITDERGSNVLPLLQLNSKDNIVKDNTLIDKPDDKTNNPIYNSDNTGENK